MQTLKSSRLAERLTLRYLTIDDSQQFNDFLRYSFQVTNKVLNDLGYDVDELRQSKFPILRKATILGWFEEGKLASQLAIYPMKVNVHGKLFKMGGITAVATYPEYSGQGLVSALMLRAMEEMRQAGQNISFLYPYSVPFYRKKGWEIVSDRMRFCVKDTQLPPRVEVGGYVERVSLDHPDYRDVHDIFTRSQHGALQRTELEWEEYWRWEVDDTCVALYYSQQEEPLGYVVYTIYKEQLKIKEMVYLSEEARQGLWNYLSAHFSMVREVKGFNFSGQPIAFTLPDTAIEESINTYYMARIVDVCQFLNDYPFKNPPKEQSFHLVISDPLVAWNRGSFIVSWDEKGKQSCVHQNCSLPALHMSIGTLTTLLMSYRLASYLYEIGHIQGERELVERLEDLIKEEKVYFSDYF